jgi:hypothetical protein
MEKYDNTPVLTKSLDPMGKTDRAINQHGEALYLEAMVNETGQYPHLFLFSHLCYFR